MFDERVHCVLEDGAGYFWISCLHGVYKVRRQELNEVANGKTNLVHCVSYGEADGMPSSETSGGHQPVGWKAQDGRLWFATVKGVAVIDPKSIQDNTNLPPVVIEQVIVDGKIICGDGSETDLKGSTSPDPQLPTLNPQRQNQSLLTSAPTRLAPGRARLLEIRYTANSFAAPEKVRFKYWLEGHDKGWLDADSKERVARFTNLRPGDYTFHVKACNNHGYWNETGDHFSFSLAPKFTETGWFPASLALSGVGLSLALVTWRLRWQRRLMKLEEQRAWANERTRIARDLHDDLGTALTGLALELNVTRHAAPASTELPQRLAESARHTRDLAERMREVVWAVNLKCDNVPGLASFLEQQASRFLRSAGLQVRVDFPDTIPARAVNSDTRHQLALAFREALTNVVRHAAATKVTITLAIEDNSLLLRVADDGCGFCPESVRNGGHGLDNLRARLEHVGGRFECVSSPGAGTIVTFVVPLGSEALGESCS